MAAGRLMSRVLARPCTPNSIKACKVFVAYEASPSAVAGASQISMRHYIGFVMGVSMD